MFTIFFRYKAAHISRRICIACLLIIPVIGCSNSPKVQRIDSDSVTDLSGMWNDTDSRLVAEEMTKDLLSQGWYNRVQSQSGEYPSIIVGQIRNKSHEHIDTDTFIKNIERAIVNSGLIDLVASRGQRLEIREERNQQDLHASSESRKTQGQELGADLLLQGSIVTLIDANDDQQARYYQVDLELVEIETTRKVWIGQKEIKKLLEKNKWRL